jgi:hypothetical protein
MSLGLSHSKKLLPSFRAQDLSYPFIAEHESQYSVSTMCSVPGVSISGYYTRPTHARRCEIAQESHQIFHAH